MPRDSNMSHSVAQLVGVGLEIGERGEDLAGRDEAALAYLREHMPTATGARRTSLRDVIDGSPVIGLSRSVVVTQLGFRRLASSVIHVTNCSADASAASQCSDDRAFASASSSDLTSDVRGSSRLNIDVSSR